MLMPILLALLMLGVNLALLSAGMAGFSRWLAWREHHGIHTHSFVSRMLLMYVVLLMLLLATLVQVANWAAIYQGLDEFEDFTTAFYFSAVSFATLGYGDLVLSKPWRLLGPIEAINGSLMLGLFASALYETLQKMRGAR
ncbi:potassium channel family protein [Andreprevotia chitinilytica]|uniref:potassium channel family protein n=1 Tax=Andreprevotia chitinilytica TaxID=396808 RepID=UPI0005580028|nr:potassium channel family protein [Andreprevotia chitinilytica]